MVNMGKLSDRVSWNMVCLGNNHGIHTARRCSCDIVPTSVDRMSEQIDYPSV